MFVWGGANLGLKISGISNPDEDIDGDEGCNRICVCTVYLAVNNKQSKALKVS